MPEVVVGDVVAPSTLLRLRLSSPWSEGRDGGQGVVGEWPAWVGSLVGLLSKIAYMYVWYGTGSSGEGSWYTTGLVLERWVRDSALVE